MTPGLVKKGYNRVSTRSVIRKCKRYETDRESEVAMCADRTDTANLLKAIEFASRKHSTQRRKDVDASPSARDPR